MSHQVSNPHSPLWRLTMHATRAKFIASAGVFAIPAVIRYPAGAAEFEYKLALTTPISGNPPPTRAAAAAEKITRESGGRLEIKVFPNSVLGGQEDISAQLRLVSIEMVLMPNSTASTT